MSDCNQNQRNENHSFRPVMEQEKKKVELEEMSSLWPCSSENLFTLLQVHGTFEDKRGIEGMRKNNNDNSTKSKTYCNERHEEDSKDSK